MVAPISLAVLHSVMVIFFMLYVSCCVGSDSDKLISVVLVALMSIGNGRPHLSTVSSTYCNAV